MRVCVYVCVCVCIINTGMSAWGVSACHYVYQSPATILYVVRSKEETALELSECVVLSMTLSGFSRLVRSIKYNWLRTGYPAHCI